MNWETYNQSEADGVSTGSSQDMFTENIDVAVEITAVDKHMVETQFTGNAIAGEGISYTFNRYGQLTCKFDTGWDIKGGMMKAVMRAIASRHEWFQPMEEVAVGSQWTILKGVLFPNGSKIEVGLLTRGEAIIGIYKKGTNLSRTIKWFEKTIYKSNAWRNMQTHSLREFRPEVKNEIYSHLAPEFTREDELEEMSTFIESLSNRRLSNDELQILHDIKDTLDRLL